MIPCCAVAFSSAVYDDSNGSDAVVELDVPIARATGAAGQAAEQSNGDYGADGDEGDGQREGEAERSWSPSTVWALVEWIGKSDLADAGRHFGQKLVPHHSGQDDDGDVQVDYDS